MNMLHLRRPHFLRSARPAILALLMTPLLASAGLFDDEEARKAIVDLRNRIDRVEQQDQQQAQQLNARKTENTDLAEQVNILKRGMLDLNGQIEMLRADLARLRGQDEQAGQSARDLLRELASSPTRRFSARTFLRHP